MDQGGGEWILDLLENKGVFPYSSLRPGQKEISELVKSSVENASVAIINAPTGFGKTAAVIDGLLKGNAEKVLWIVRTINEMYPVIRELKKFNCKYTFLFSAKRTCPLFGLNTRDEDPNNVDFWENCKLARINGKCNYYLKSLNIQEDLSDYIFSLETNTAFDQAISILTHFSSCPFFSLTSLIDKVRFVIATYPYFFKDEIFKKILEKTEMENLVVVIDEAHSLLNMSDLFSIKLSLHDIEDSLKEIKDYGYSGTEVEKAIKKVYKVANNVRPKGENVLRLVKKELFNEITTYYDIILDVSEDIREKKFRSELYMHSPIRNLTVKLSHLALWVESLSDENNYLFASTEDNNYRLISIPLDPSRVISAPLEKPRAVIMMSGTIPPGDFVNDLLNINKKRTFFDAELMTGSSRIGNYMAIVVGDVTTLYKSRNEIMYKRIVHYLNKIGNQINGVKLVVYPSYEIMEKVSGSIDSRITQIKEEKKTSLNQILHKLKEGSDDLMIHSVAGGKITEGIEITENGKTKISAVIIVGIPYPQRDEYLVNREKVLSKRLGISKARFYLYKVSSYIRIKQALGRAIRGPSDIAVYFLMDYRYIHSEIKRLLRIRYDRVTKSIKEFDKVMPEVKKFFKERNAKK